jgi:hypothetical protein
MAEVKTKLTETPVADFINAIPDTQVRQDCWSIIDLMQAAAKAPPKMWGSSIVGFGSYTYTYASGKTGDWPLIAFSPRKQNLTIYNLAGSEAYTELGPRLGKHTASKGCLYVKRLSDLDLPTFEKLIQAVVDSKQKGAAPS